MFASAAFAQGGSGDAPAEAGGEEPSASAEPPGAPDAPPAASEKPEDDLVERAITLRKQRNESAARELLRKAYETDKSPRVAGHLGLAERALGLAQEAEVHLLEALAASKDPWVVENQQLLQDALRYAERQLAWARIVVRPAGVTAKVTVAGEVVDASKRVRVKAGSIVIEATAPGYVSSRVSTEIPPEKELLVTLDLRKVEPERTEPHPPPPPPPKDPPSGPPTAAYLLLGGGALALGVGGYFGLRALSEKNTADDLCPSTTCTNREGVDADDNARRFALYSDIGLGVGIVALGIATYLFLTDSPRRQNLPKQGKLRLQLAGGTAGASWHF
ncbi:MAG: hypothetical protein KC492_08295 [Myxococcales bacterium]|nr:hypothetical protein [Myxococcales bacterium]